LAHASYISRRLSRIDLDLPVRAAWCGAAKFEHHYQVGTQRVTLATTVCRFGGWDAVAGVSTVQA
jgi:hypothetical protein